ncbi:hypothetical protein EJB05_40917, partial [Eragrostis curvula]
MAGNDRNKRVQFLIEPACPSKKAEHNRRNQKEEDVRYGCARSVGLACEKVEEWRALQAACPSQLPRRFSSHSLQPAAPGTLLSADQTLAMASAHAAVGAGCDMVALQKWLFLAS